MHEIVYNSLNKFFTLIDCNIENLVSLSRHIKAIIFNAGRKWESLRASGALGEKERLERARGPIIESA